MQTTKKYNVTYVARSLTFCRRDLDVGRGVVLETVAIATDRIGEVDRLTLLLQLLK